MEAMFAKFNAWKDKYKDNIIYMGGKLNGEGTVVSSDSVSDGPFVESKEIIGGFMIITAENMAMATEVVPTLKNPQRHFLSDDTIDKIGCLLYSGVFMLSRLGSVLLLLCLIPPAIADELGKFNRTLSSEFAKELKQNSVPGAAYVVVKNNQVLALETFGHVDKAKTKAIDPDTVFRLASVSKTFAATITTMLAQEQQLNLSDPVTKYVPNFTLARKGAAERIQLKHLLSHSTGLVPNAYDNLLHEDWSMEKIIKRFKRVKPLCKPEQCYGYQNVAFGFLQSAIEASQSKSFSTLLHERVFSPLNMQNASVGIEVFKQAENTAKPHIVKKRIKTGRKDKQGEPINKYFWRTVKVEPDFYKVETAAGVNASITDLAKWLNANLGHRPEVLSEALLQELTTKRIKTRKDLRRKYWRSHLTDAHYGYGWRIYEFKGHPIIYHSGWVAGFVAEVGYAPHLDVGFAVLINAESGIISKMSNRFWTKAYTLAEKAVQANASGVK